MPTMSPSPLLDFTGTDRFEIRGRLGAGGMGVVYDAFDRQRRQHVALKTLQRLDDAATVYRFKQEFRALADVAHPNLVRLEELIEAGGRWFFTMELVEGTDFLHYVCPADGPVPQGGTPYVDIPTASQTVAPGDDVPPVPDPEATAADGPGPAPPSPVRLRAALRQLAAGLGELHSRGKLHRDIKPSNVLVTPEGRVVLLDFGLATDLEGQTDDQKTDHQVVGTAAYMAPEQAEGRPLTPASDWYSVGVMLYRALTGRLPFRGSIFDLLSIKTRMDPPPPNAVAAGIPDDLAALCVDLLRRCPDDRPSGREVLRRLGAEAVGASVPTPPARGPLFVGRESHLAALAEAFAAVRRGRMVAAFVHGRSGAGKSALVQRFLDGLRRRESAVVLAGRCYEQESVAYKALDTLVDALSHYLRRLSDPEIDALLPRDVQSLTRLFPVLRRVEAVARVPRRAAEIPDPQEMRRRGVAALRELLARIGDRKPLVLFIDDLQWGDRDSAELLTELLRPPDPPVLLLIGCYRREDAAVSPCLVRLLQPGEAALTGPQRREVAVEALTPEESRDLVLTLLGRDDPATRALAERIVREAGGSPYFVSELVQYLTEGGELTDSLAAAGVVALDEVLWRRVVRLPREARLVLEVLAVAGRPLRQADACGAAGLEAEGFAALTLLRRDRLVRGTGPGPLDEVETYHDRIRETVLTHLDPGTRRVRHQALARELESCGWADPETLALHFAAAGVLPKAGHYYAAAAAEAATALAFERAATLYRRALGFLRAGDGADRGLRGRLADALANAGRGAEAAYAYQEAAAGADPGEVIELQRRAAYQFLISGHIDEGLAAFDLLLAQVGMWLSGTPRRALLRMLLYRTVLRLRGLGFRERDAGRVPPGDLLRVDISRSVALGISIVDVIEGANWQAQASLRALRAGEPLRIALALAWEAVHSACQGQAARRRTAKLIRAADALAQKIGHPHAIGMATLSAGCVEFLEGRFRPALVLVDGAATILREQCAGVVWELDTAHIFGLWSLICLGRLGELRGRFRCLFQEARERGDRYLEATTGTRIESLAWLGADEVGEARARADEAVRHWSQQRFHIQHLNRLCAHLENDLYAGDGPAAWRRLCATRPALEASLLLRIQLVRIDVLHFSGRCAVAAAAVAADPRPLLAAAEGYARRLDRQRVAWASAWSLLIRAGAASVRGDAGARALLTDAVAAFDSVDMGLYAAAARRRLGGLLGGNEGRALIQQADAWMTAQAIRNPARMAASAAPGFPDR
jgi:hypothetical protein